MNRTIEVIKTLVRRFFSNMNNENDSAIFNVIAKTGGSFEINESNRDQSSLPLGDTLRYTLYDTITNQYIVLSLETDWFNDKSFKYSQFIINLNGKKYSQDEFTNKNALEEFIKVINMSEYTDYEENTVYESIDFVYSKDDDVDIDTYWVSSGYYTFLDCKKE